jgi:hypothetical protein
LALASSALARGMADLIPLVLSNFTVACLALGFACAGVAIARRPGPRSRAFAVEKLLAWYLFFPIGVAFLYTAIMHTFFADFTAAFIGWAPSPFQFEVGMASLGFSIVGFLAFRGTLGLRAAAVIAPAVFLLGAAAGHVVQMVRAANFAPGNAGSIFYTDILVPVIGLVLLWLAAADADHSRLR